MLRRLTLGVFALAATGFAHAGQAQTSRMDTTAIPLFWRLHDVLARDEEPADSLWRALWQHPGYALLEQRERRRADLTEAMRLAYKPSLRASADSQLTQTNWRTTALTHLKTIPAWRDSIARFLGAFERDGLFEAGVLRAQSYLPAGTTDRHPRPNAAFMFYLDARGYPERLLLDPLYFMLLPGAVNVLGHEFHHYYASKLAKPHRDFGTDLLAWTFQTTEAEGIAGLIDKADIPRLTDAELRRRYPLERQYKYFVDYQVEYRKADERLRQTEHALARWVQQPDSGLPIGRWLRTHLADNGRILGAFMAVVIEQNLGKNRLTAVIGDPFEFWRLYGLAARPGREPAGLNNEALQALRALESKYYDPPR